MEIAVKVYEDETDYKDKSLPNIFEILTLKSQEQIKICLFLLRLRLDEIFYLGVHIHPFFPKNLLLRYNKNME